jgi:hypothetical protein
MVKQTRKGNFLSYLGSAFGWHWNLLVLAAGTAAAFLLNVPDVVLPILGAGEILYLVSLASHPRFQRAVDARIHKKEGRVETEEAGRRLQVMLRSLEREDRLRFIRLRDRCRTLSGLASSLHSAEGASTDHPLEGIRSQGLDRLLWVHLRLLYSKATLERFFRHTDRDGIQARMEKVRRDLAEGRKGAATPRMVQSLEDNLATTAERLENLERAERNLDFISMELDRIENKIAGISEMAIHRHDPDYISSQVDGVAASVMETEKTMSEVSALTGLPPQDREVPEILGRPENILEVEA